MNNTCINPITKMAVEPVKPKVLGIKDTMYKLYEVLQEIESNTSRVNSFMFGSPASELCPGDADCLESHLHAALDMANRILEEVIRLRSGLEG